MVNTIAKLTATNATLTEQLKKALSAKKKNQNGDSDNVGGGNNGGGGGGGDNRNTPTTRRGQNGVTLMPIAGHAGIN